MRQRLISAAVLVPVVVLVFLLGDPWLTVGIALLAALSAVETARLVRLAGLRAVGALAIAAPVISVLAFAVLGAGGVELGWLLVGPAVGVWIIVAALPALREHDPIDGYRTWLGTVFAGLYPSLLAFAVGVATVQMAPDAGSLGAEALDPGRLWLLVLVATVWTFDSLAYVSGRLFPRGRFMYHVSPAKTWSGVVGGTLAAVIVCAALVSALFGAQPWVGAVLGALLAFAAQAGDLAESMLKRAAGAKDSGDLIPGHGGFLDRVDSFLFAAPVLYATLLLARIADGGGA